MMPFIFFIAAQISYDFGVLGQLGFSMMWLVVYLFLYVVSKRAHFLREDLLLASIFNWLYRIEILICITLIFKIIVTETFFHYIAIIYLILLFVIPIAMLYMMKLNGKIVVIGTILLGITLTFLIPILVYLKVSIPTVYSGIQFLSVESLQFNQLSTLLLVISLGAVFIVHQFQYRQINSVEQRQEFLPYFMAGMIAAITTISFGSISFLGRAQAVLPDLSDRACIQIINRFGGQFGQFLLVGTLIYISFFTLLHLWKGMKQTIPQRMSYSFLLYIALPIIIALYIEITLLQVLLLFGLGWSSLFGLLFFHTSSHWKSRASVGIAFFVAIIVAFFTSLSIGILAGALASILLMGLFQLQQSYSFTSLID